MRWRIRSHYLYCVPSPVPRAHVLGVTACPGAPLVPRFAPGFMPLPASRAIHSKLRSSTLGLYYGRNARFLRSGILLTVTWNSPSLSVARFTGSCTWCDRASWGSARASLRPRLYAVTRFAGFPFNIMTGADMSISVREFAVSIRPNGQALHWTLLPNRTTAENAGLRPSARYEVWAF